MSGDQYKGELAKRYNGEVIVPTGPEQETIGRIILDELVNGEVFDASRKELLDIVAQHKADGVILGCTELCMILAQEHFDLPVFDRSEEHTSELQSH